MPKIREFDEEFLVKLLENASSANHTPTWQQLLGDHERLLYLLIGHASVDVTFNVQTADDSSGTNAADIFSADKTVDAVGFATLEVSSAILNRRGQYYVAPQVTRSAGTYSLLEVRYDLRKKGDLASLYDATWLIRDAQLT